MPGQADRVRRRFGYAIMAVVEFAQLVSVGRINVKVVRDLIENQALNVAWE